MYYDIVNSGERIKELRAARRMTRQQLAEQIGLSVDALRKIEAGVNGAKIDTLISIAELFHITLDYLVCGCERKVEVDDLLVGLKEKEVQFIEEKAAATGMTPSADIRTMALDGGNVDMTSHEDRQKLMYELSTIGNNINQIARMANTNVFISKSDVQEVNEQLKQIQRLLLQYIRNR